MGGFLGKYSRIIFGITLFLIIVLGVLGISYINTLNLQDDVNISESAATQAGLQQRLSKSLLTAYNAYTLGDDYEGSLEEITTTSLEFTKGLEELNNDQLALEIGKDNIETTSVLWTPLVDRIKEIEFRLDEVITAGDDAETFQTVILGLSESVPVTVSFIEQILTELSQGLISEQSGFDLGLVLELQEVNARKVEEKIYIIANKYSRGLTFENDLEDLEKALNGFDGAISVFKQGGELSTLRGEKIAFPALSSEKNDVLIGELEEIFKPLKADVTQLQKSVTENGTRATIPSLFVDVLSYTQENTNTLAGQMQSLSDKAVAQVEDLTNTNTNIQVFGAIASALIFLYILSNFFGNLRRSDEEVAVAQRESTQIFDTVDQGLFLLNDETKIGGQYSKELESIFGTEDVANKNLLQFLKDTVSEEDLSKLTRYIKLLFNPKKKERLIKDLNPIQKIAVQVHEHGRVSDKFLRFGFSRVFDESKNIESILTSVSDITREALLEKQLEKEAKRNDQQVALLTTLMNADTNLIPLFLRNSESTYDQMNDVLREDSKSFAEYKEKANKLGALIHKVKGESSALSIHVVTELCEEFEDNLDDIYKSDQADGNSFLPLVVILKNLISNNELIADLNERIFSKRTIVDKASESGEYTGPDRRKSTNYDSSYLFEYAQKVAKRLDKKVQLKKSGLDSPNLPRSLIDALPAFTSQFIRNSIAHGIESAEERAAKGKPEIGRLNVSLINTSEGYELEVFDDGKGIDEKEVAARALKLGLVSEEELSQFSKQKIIGLIFKAGFTTNDEVDEDSGRGMGMSAISTLIEELKGRIWVSTKAGEYAKFVIRFPSNIVENQAA